MIWRIVRANAAFWGVVLTLQLGIACGVLRGEEPVRAPVYNLRLVTDSTPDLTDLPHYLRSITAQHATPQAKAIAIWRWSQRMRKQTSNPYIGKMEVLDPILLFNNYGHCNCGIVSGLNNTFWLNMGWRAHYVQLGDHTVCETSWDNGQHWHMFDASMSMYCFNDEGSVASVTEIEKNPHFYLANFAPECGTNPVKDIHDHQGWRLSSDRPVGYARSLANGWDSFKPGNGISEYDLHARWGARYVLNLRPQEQYTRYFGPPPGDVSNERLHRPLKTGKDPQSQHGHLGIRANGVWHYAPNLRGPRAADLVYDQQNIAWGDKRLGFAARVANTEEPGVIVLRVTAANVVTSAKLNLIASRQAASDAVEVEVSTTAGIQYKPVWKWNAIGVAQRCEIDLLPQVIDASEYLVKIKLQGPGAGLEAVELETLTQINRASLPKLVRGDNRVQLTLGAQAETVQFHPALLAGEHRATISDEQRIDVETETGYYKPVLRPAENGVPCSVTWRVSVPTPITAMNFGGNFCVKSPHDRATLLHSWDGQSFSSDFEKTDGSAPFDLMINREVKAIPTQAKTAYARYEFQTKSHARSYSGPGIQSARITLQHEPKVRGFTPIEVTYCWVEHRASGDVERRHTQLIESPAEEYHIHVAGFRDPTMRWVRVNLQGSQPSGEKVVYGYADGIDVGTQAAAQRELYTWGKNLAHGRDYQLTGQQSERNADDGHDLTDGVIAPPDDHVSKKYMPTNVIFEPGMPAVCTIDLGQEQTVAAVRVHAAQEQGFKLAFPATIKVEASRDGQAYAEVGQATHHQVFHPQADFGPWEHDDSPQYAGLPAGGRLAFAYRVIFDKPSSARYIRVTCAPQSGWGLLLSEIQAFDRVEVQKEVPPLVYLPTLSELATPFQAPGMAR